MGGLDGKGRRFGAGGVLVTTQSAVCTSPGSPSGSAMHAWLLDLAQSTNVHGSVLMG